MQLRHLRRIRSKDSDSKHHQTKHGWLTTTRQGCLHQAMVMAGRHKAKPQTAVTHPSGAAALSLFFFFFLSLSLRNKEDEINERTSNQEQTWCCVVKLMIAYLVDSRIIFPSPAAPKVSLSLSPTAGLDGGRCGQARCVWKSEYLGIADRADRPNATWGACTGYSNILWYVQSLICLLR